MPSRRNRSVRSQVSPVLAVVLLIASTAAATVTPQPRLAPLAAARRTALPPGCGFLPPSFATGHLTPGPAIATDKDLPARFDWRTAGCVSPVKNQGSCGACYAFGAAAQFEALLLKNGHGPYDLSENNVKECNYLASSCGGGNQWLAMNLWTRVGTVLESCDPYQPVDVPCASGCAAEFSVIDWWALSGATVPPTDALKQYLQQRGPLHTTVYAGDASNPAWQSAFYGYDGEGALYYDGTDEPNHSVLLVGWDDTIAHAGGHGAWIVKNSWGDAWGGSCDYGDEGGYFYIAYRSASIGCYASLVRAYAAADDQVAVRGYDEAGYSGAFGFGGAVAWGLCRFPCTATAYLHRVEFWTSDATVDVDIYVYGSFADGTLSELLASKLDLAYPAAGYHSAALDAPLRIAAGQTLYVAVRFRNTTYTYPLVVDGSGPPESATTWASHDGSGWTDLGGFAVDAAIRIRTSTSDVLVVDDPDADRQDEFDDLPRSPRLLAVYPNPFNPATNVAFALDVPADLELSVFSLSGRRVRVLTQERYSAGSHTVTWNGCDDAGAVLPAGVYVVRLESGSVRQAMKLVLLK